MAAQNPATTTEEARGEPAVPKTTQRNSGLRSGHSDYTLSTGLMRIVCFALIALTVAFALDWIFDSGLKKIRTSKFGAINRWSTGAANADIIINGSSRALTHYDPRIISAKTRKSTYNLGMNGVQIDLQLAVLKAYLQVNKKPKIVIQNLESFSFEATKPGSVYDPGLYLPYLNHDPLYDAIRKIEPNAWKWKHIPLYGYAVEDMRFTWALGIGGHLGMQPREDYFFGFNPRYQEWKEDFDQFRRNMPDGVEYKIEQAGVDALTEVLELCRREGIRAILVYSPVYVEMQMIERNRRLIFSKFREIAAQFNTPLWDFSDVPLCASKAYFYNSQHLNAQGANLFSNLIGEELAKELVKSVRDD